MGERDASPLLLSQIFLPAWWRHLLLITSSSNQGQQDLLVALFLQLGKEVGEREREMKRCFTPVALPDFSSSLVETSIVNGLKLNQGQ